MAGVHRLEHVEGLAGADLADDDAVWTHAERVAYEVALGHFATALERRRTCLKADDVRLLELQLGGVLHGDDAFCLVNQLADGV